MAKAGSTVNLTFLNVSTDIAMRQCEYVIHYTSYCGEKYGIVVILEQLSLLYLLCDAFVLISKQLFQTWHGVFIVD